MTRVKELTNEQLDLVIARHENIKLELYQGEPRVKRIVDHEFNGKPIYGYTRYNPSTNWSVAGPMLETGKITVEPHGEQWCAHSDLNEDSTAFGDTYLEAAMRSYVITNLGHEVEVPDITAQSAKSLKP